MRRKKDITKIDRKCWKILKALSDYGPKYETISRHLEIPVTL